jgi:thiol-disulfide isomerase/thioredoxin
VVSQPAPDVRTIRWFNSELTSFADLRGRVVLVDLWATWCGPCVAKLPEIHRLAKELGPDGLATVLVHARHTKTPGPQTKDVVAESVLPAFIQRHRITLPVAIADQNVFESLGIRGIPHYVLIDRQGVVRYSTPGRPPDAATIRALLRDQGGSFEDATP